jgi:hypothetical protein
MRKIECDECGAILYGSASALTRSGLPSCPCGGEYVIPNLRDRLAVGDPEAIAHVEEVALAEAGQRLERDARRAEREQSSGFTTRAANCGVCGRFKPRPADRCDYCGDEPATFGATAGERREAERIHNRGQGYAA